MPVRADLEQIVLSRADIRETISGNLCRCTGYEAIVDAIKTCVKSATT